MTLRPGDRLGPYQILSALGGGGMGEVYRARDTKLGRDVALKVLPESVAADPECRARFQHEAQILAALNHPNIAAIYGLEDSLGVMALVMELVEGKPLSEYIRPRPQGMPLGDALGYAIQIAFGLEAAHKAGVVHRDLKPSNVMITPTGGVKLVDFGLAKLLENSQAATSLNETETMLAQPKTEEGRILGTVVYMSPEQAQGKPVDARSDLFSFGSMLYEMLTGCRPFQGETRLSTLASILQQEPTPPGELRSGLLPREVERLILRCLRKDPERRFQTAADLRLALEDLREESSSGQLAPVSVPVRQTLGRWQWIAVLVLPAIVFVVAGSWLSRHKAPLSRPLRQITFDAGAVFSPALSPDGKLLAYVSDRGGRPDIWLRQMAGGSPVRVTSGPEPAANPQFSPDGTRIYYRGGTDIFEVPTLSGGSPRKVVANAGPFSISSRGEIAFVRLATGLVPGPITIVPADGTPEVIRPECKTLVPGWSPAGDQLIFVGVCNSEIFPPKLYRAGRRGGPPEALSLPGTLPLMLNPPAWFRLRAGSEGIIVPLRNGDSVNLYRRGFDGKTEPVTFGTGLEDSPVVSPAGELIFARTEATAAIWSLELEGGGAPLKEIAPANMFAVSRDGRKLVYGRVLGSEKGQIVLRDRVNGNETVLAVQDTHVPFGIGSFWPQISPDGNQVVYRVPPQSYIVNVDSGQPRLLISMKDFNLASDWSPDGKRIIGECQPTKEGICELDPSTGKLRRLLKDSHDGELLYPIWSWDGKWLAFMLRRGTTEIVATPVRADGSLAGEADWVRISPPDASAARPRFSPDGAGIYYLLSREASTALVRQRLDPATMRPLGNPVNLAAIPPQVYRSAVINVVSVSRDRVFFNTVDVRGNIWMTGLQ